MAVARPDNLLRVERVCGASSVTSRRASYPLRFLFTSCKDGAEGAESAVWAYVITFGGGLVSGDEVVFDVEVDHGARLVLTTQASTKVYKRIGDAVARQTMRASVAEGALLCVAPDPVTCFQSARYEQTQHVDMEVGGNLVLLDWITSGRVNGHNEVWDMDLYSNNTRVSVGGRPIFLENVVLEQAAPGGGGSIRARMGSAHVMATLLFTGPLFEERPALLGAVPERSGEVCAGVVLARAPMLDGRGLVVRLLGADVERVRVQLAKLLAPLSPLLGDSPFRGFS